MMRVGNGILVAIICMMVLVLRGAVCVALGAVESMPMSEKVGLLVIAHGAPAPRWNAPVLELEKDIIAELQKRKTAIQVAKVCFMEFSESSVATGVADLEKAECRRIIAVPLLVAPSRHSHWDIPALLGLYSDPQIIATLRKEKAEIASAHIPITLTETLSAGDVLLESALDRIRELSQNANEEAVVIFAHGDESMAEAWEDLLRRTTTYVCGKAGISYGDWACVGMGQSYVSNGVPVIEKAAAARKRVLVVGLYLVSDVERIHRRFGNTLSPSRKTLFDGRQVVFARRGLLPDRRVATWIVESALAADDSRSSAGDSGIRLDQSHGQQPATDK